jgi:hypothetical protein
LLAFAVGAPFFESREVVCAGRAHARRPGQPWSTLWLWLTVCVPISAWAEEDQHAVGVGDAGAPERVQEPPDQVTPAPDAGTSDSQATDATQGTKASPVAAPPNAGAAPPAPATPATSAHGAGPGIQLSGEPGKGLTVTTGDRFSLNLRSRIQLRYQINVPPADAAGERDLSQMMGIGTARLWFSGHVFTPNLAYMIQLALASRDYRDGAVSPVYDAYLDWKAHRDLNVRAGQFFVPFDRLRTVRESALQMADRPRPVSELTLDRDAGVTFYSDRFLGERSPVAWRLGAFGGGGPNLTAGKQPGVLLVGRLELRPLGPIDDSSEGDLERRRKPGLALGGGFAGNWNTNRLRSTTGATFSGGTTDYYHAAGDLVFKWLGVALEAEYIWKRAAADQIVSTNADGSSLVEYTRSAHGWILQTSYVFDPPIEIVARLSRMYAFAGTDPKLVSELDAKGQEVAAGLNYYVNGHRFKVQADWIARLPPDFTFDRADHVVHVQLDATF